MQMIKKDTMAINISRRGARAKKDANLIINVPGQSCVWVIYLAPGTSLDSLHHHH